MKIGIIGPSKLKTLEKINPDFNKIISGLAKKVAESKNEIVLTADKGSSSEIFAKEYLKNHGKKIYSIIPMNDKEFGYSWVNVDLGEKINCGTWENQPERLDKESDILICLGYAEGSIIEIMYTKWFKAKVYVIKELVSGKLPIEIDDLDLKYISFKDFEKELKSLNS